MTVGTNEVTLSDLFLKSLDTSPDNHLANRIGFLGRISVMKIHCGVMKRSTTVHTRSVLSCVHVLALLARMSALLVG